MSLELWLLFAAASVGVTLTPGPNGLLAITNGARYGVRLTVFTVLGGALGFLTLIAISLAGFGALLAASEQAFTVLKWFGAAYLVYLGVQVWRSPPPDLRAVARSVDAPAGHPFRIFRQGFIVAVSNPKCILFFAAFLPQFMSPDASFATHMVVLGGTFVFIETAYELLLASFAQRIAPWLSRSGRWFNRIAGGAFVGMGAAIAASSR